MVIKTKVQRGSLAAAQRTIEARKSLKRGASRRATGRRNIERRRYRAPQKQLGAMTWHLSRVFYLPATTATWNKEGSKEKERARILVTIL